ncbi:LppA family lipoprotein [Nocardia asteroides]|uniref:LppA family lipoprotein n=1 Tax=Nocardia asteroides TaxID=1824 RepID=UPI001E501DBB|nr:LppA family lipoprotein [Nocardia asteroides]UGT62996.1 LppA family lipoprotein [Nocardia asteroides]
MSVRLVALLAAAWSVSGCATLLGYPADPPGPAEFDAAAAEVAALPRSGESERALLDAVERITAAAGGLEWRRDPERPRVEGGCTGVYGPTGGLNVGLAHYVAAGTIPADRWLGFQQQARDLAAAIGADDMRPGTGTPPNYSVTFESARESGPGISVYADAGSVTITAHTGCRLP